MGKLRYVFRNFSIIYIFQNHPRPFNSYFRMILMLKSHTIFTFSSKFGQYSTTFVWSGPIVQRHELLQTEETSIVGITDSSPILLDARKY